MPSSNPEVSEMSDSEGDYRSRSRSQSRRARRKKNTQKQQPSKKAPPSMPSVPEDQQASAQSSAQAPNGQASADSQAMTQQKPQGVEESGMQPFEWIGPDSTSMDGPVTYARAQRGEIPARPGNPDQKLVTAEDKPDKSILDYDGLKLRLDLNLDIEIELKARIQGDLTLALM